MSVGLAIGIGLIAGIVIWYVVVRPWQKREYERELERRRRRH